MWRYYWIGFLVVGLIVAASCSSLSEEEQQKLNGDLVRAVAQGDATAAKAVLESGADANAKDEEGLTVLMSASLGQNTELVKTLLEGGADVNFKSEQGTTAWMLASNRDIIALLEEAGAEH